MAPFVEVAVGLPVRGLYHYAVPASLPRAKVGARVLVPFGTRGVTGVVVREAETAPPDMDVVQIKEVREVLDDAPALDAPLVELCLWIADYYEAAPGEVIRAALPAGTQVSSSARPRPTAAGQAALIGDGARVLSPRAKKLLGGAPILTKRDRTELAALVTAGLMEVVDERARARVRTKTVKIARLVRTPPVDEKLTPKRRELVERLLAGPVDLKEVSGAVLDGLVAAGIAEKTTREVSRDPWRGDIHASAPPNPLPPTPGQSAALEQIAAALEPGTGYRSFLLHGVTGSGKTEVYLQAIARVLARGQGALVLVPEIALTPQLAARFRARFGDQVAVLHSGLSDGERFDQWRRLRSGSARIALGARSAVFAPIAGLGMIVVDEEHDPSFKQEEGVRYHARDVALVRAQRAGAVCVLGSATPSMESYARAREGKHQLLVLRDRAHAKPMPEVDIVDLRLFRADPSSMLTAPLAAALEATLASGEQAILFLNRRGFATFVVCVGCGHRFTCPHCSVSLTYHRYGDRLRCHYCAHSEHVPISCPKCQSSETIRRFGLGTERIEEALRVRYPTARVARLDRDTASGRGLETVLGRVARREVDILVGTQMVTKGHDFPGVTLVGVLCADTALSLPDFRAAERTFQLLTQVAGRAGRGERPGRVIVQSYSPEHAAIQCARTHDYEAFFEHESEVRAELGYPPHGRQVAVRIDGIDEHHVRQVAEDLAARAGKMMTTAGAVTVLGPSEAPLAKLKGRARWHLWLKSADRAQLRAFSRRLLGGLDVKDVRVTVDVDPMSAL